MKVILILPPQFLVVQIFTPKSFSIFLDTQAELIDLDMKRYLVEHQVPGREGGILQDMGSQSSVISLRGKWIYENRSDDDVLKFFPSLKIFGGGSRIGWNWLRLQVMQMVYRYKFPLYLSSDLMTSAVMIEHMHFTYRGGSPNAYEYVMTLKEFNPALTVLGSIGMSVLGSNLTSININEVGY